MKCPHCSLGIKFEPEHYTVHQLEKNATEQASGIELSYGFCPECKNLIVLLKYGEYRWIDDQGELTEIRKEDNLYPKFSRRIIDPLVPTKYAEAFNEANSVLSISPKASAALSRRLLQSLIRDEYEITFDNLSKEIDAFLKLPDIPSYVKEAVDAIRKVGNWAAHPNKYEVTGEIVNVESEEAGWLIDVLEALFDVTFIEPKKTQERKDKLNKKLSALGELPMK